jgi:hypothetical protein
VNLHGLCREFRLSVANGGFASPALKEDRTIFKLKIPRIMSAAPVVAPALYLIVKIARSCRRYWRILPHVLNERLQTVHRVACVDGSLVHRVRIDESQPLHPLHQAEIELRVSRHDGRELGTLVGLEVLRSHD